MKLKIVKTVELNVPVITGATGVTLCALNQAEVMFKCPEAGTCSQCVFGTANIKKLAEALERMT